MTIRWMKKHVFLSSCLAVIISLVTSCPGFCAKSDKNDHMLETERHSELMAEVRDTLKEGNRLFLSANELASLLVAVEKAPDSPALETISRLILECMDQAFQVAGIRRL